MPEITSTDDYQQNVIARNRELGNLLLGAWSDETIIKIRRDPEPSGETTGTWVAETN